MRCSARFLPIDTQLVNYDYLKEGTWWMPCPFSFIAFLTSLGYALRLSKQKCINY